MTKFQKLTLIFLAVVIVVLGSVFAFVFMKVNSVKYFITANFEPYDYQNGVLLSKTDTKAMRFIKDTGAYRVLEMAVFDLSQYEGAEGLELENVTAYRDASNLIPVSQNALPYYNLDDCFIYGIAGEEKYLVDTVKRTISPLLDQSSANIEGVCTNGQYFIAKDGEKITVLERKDRTSNEIISRKEIEFPISADSVEFVKWYNERHALMRLNNSYYTSYAVIDALSGEATVLATTNDAPAFLTEPLEDTDDNPTKGMLKAYNEIISDKYLQFYDNIQDETSADSYYSVPSGRYVDIFTGIQYDTGLNSEVFDGANKLCAVSPDGLYSVYKTTFTADPYKNIEYVIFNSKNSKYYKLGEIISSELFIDDVFFVHDNVLFVNYAETNTGKEASVSINLSF